ncbi:hypothetical protein MPH_04618 [Macrophomina phaseolina MS6]|uniref:Uncharacterized protein n=1 Tax=Macrophomina phaseolina (strain MS6) TaxID=1126212 RepID=K2R6X9_MACPH|nr:hypothetical protein MPH_04618 [Macrophomina phaseolina MS6]
METLTAALGEYPVEALQDHRKGGNDGSEDSNGLTELDTAAARLSDFLIHALYHLHHSPGVLIFVDTGVQAEGAISYVQFFRSVFSTSFALDRRCHGEAVDVVVAIPFTQPVFSSPSHRRSLRARRLIPPLTERRVSCFGIGMGQACLFVCCSPYTDRYCVV